MGSLKVFAIAAVLLLATCATECQAQLFGGRSIAAAECLTGNCGPVTSSAECLTGNCGALTSATDQPAAYYSMAGPVAMLTRTTTTQTLERTLQRVRVRDVGPVRSLLRAKPIRALLRRVCQR